MRPAARGGETIRVAVVAEPGLTGRRAVAVLRREGFEVVRAGSPQSLIDAGAGSVAGAAVVVVVADEEVSSVVVDALADRLGDTAIVLVAPLGGRRAIGEAINKDVRGFVCDGDVGRRLGPTVHAVCAGQVAVPAELREALATPLLSPREKQVLSMVVLGLTNCETANRLFITETTVKSHLSSAYRKLGVHSRQQATALILSSSDGLGLGILSLSRDGGNGVGPG